MNNTDLSIIIVNYNVKEFLQNLLDSILKSSPQITKQIIVVDNASDDGSVEMLREKFPGICLIENKKNVGFGAANNQALEISNGKFILLLNPDTIVQEDTFSILINFFNSHPEAGLVGCKVLNPDGTLQLACRRGFPGPWTSFTKVTGLSKLFPNSKLFARYNLTYLDENQTYEVDAISGAFMLLKREVYEKVGGFDPQFFMYGEDLDLCYRIQQAGFKVYYVPDTQIIHYKGESTKRSKMDETKVFYDAMHLFVRKHFSTSFLVEIILQFAIVLRKFLTFLNIYRLIILAVILDFLFFDLAIFLSEKIYLSEHWHGYPEETLLIIYTVPAILQIIISAFLKSYKKDSISILRILYSIFIGVFVLSSVTFFFKQYAYSRAVILITYFLLLFLLPLWRFILKVFFKIGIKDDFYKSRTLIVGKSEEAAELSKRLKESFTNIHNIAGLIGTSNRDIGNKINGYEIIGSLENIKKIIRANNIDEVIFSSKEISYTQILSVVSECQDLNVDFKVAGSELDFLVGKTAVTMLDNIPLLEVSYNITATVHKVSKFILDYLISLPILLLVYPFIYFFSKLFGSKNEIVNFILKIPEVVFRKKSLVGPRTKPANQNLFLGKPGITGFWFTENLVDEKEENKLNIFYAKNQNVWLDLEILGKSLSKMLMGWR